MGTKQLLRKSRSRALAWSRIQGDTRAIATGRPLRRLGRRVVGRLAGRLMGRWFG